MKTVFYRGDQFLLSRYRGLWCCTRNGLTHMASSAADALEGWVELYGR